jgi:hypothetical protein
MRKRSPWLTCLIVFGTVILCIGGGAAVTSLPPVQESLGWRLSQARAQVWYALFPPEESVFTPDPTLAAMVRETLTAGAPTPAPSATPQPEGLPIATTIVAATSTPAPIPESVILDGVVYVDQHNRWNYCGPANLAMALNYWGWPGTRDDIARVVKPGVEDPDLNFIERGRWDKNVMPYELADFVAEQTEYGVVVRHGGTIELLKRLIAAGFPVLVEAGHQPPKVWWMGH